MTSGELLPEPAVRAALEDLPGWRLEEGRIVREHRFADFVDAWSFLSGVALQAEAMNHHPDWSNAYGRVEIRLSTHDAGGVTALDLELARRIERLLARCPG